MAELSLGHWEGWALVIATALVAGTVRGFAGFGGPAIMVLVLTQFYAPASVLALVLLADLAANLQLLPGALRQVSWRSTLPVVVASCLALPAGVLFLQGTDPHWLKRGIALLVGACACAMLADWRYRREAGPVTSFGVGLFGGAIFGATFIALPLMIFFFSGPASPARARANAITWGPLPCLAMIPLFLGANLIDMAGVWQAAFVAVVYVLGAGIGSRVFRRTSARRFRQVVLFLLLALSAIGVVT